MTAPTTPRIRVRAWPQEIVGGLLDTDLLVLGGPRAGSHGRVGLVTGSALRHAPCAVLLAPRPAFPVPVEERRNQR